MQQLIPGTRFAEAFERVILSLLQLILMIVILAAVVVLGILLWQAAMVKIGAIHDMPAFQSTLQRAFAGVLMVLLGLELLETVRAYRAEHRIRLEVIMIVAIIAVGRHIIQLDFEHVEGILLIGIGALVIALAGGYYLIKLAGRNGKIVPT